MGISALSLAIIAVVCLVFGLVFALVALRSGGHSEGQQTLLRVTREAGRSKVVTDRTSTLERAGVPILKLTLKLGRMLTPANRLEKLEKRLEHAGYPAGWDLNRILAIKALLLLVGAAFGLFAGSLVSPGFAAFLIPAIAAAGFYAPDYLLTKTAAKRTQKMRKSLADTVDMLNLTLAAGIGFDSALRLVATNNKGPLADEFSRVVQEIAIGKSRQEALRDLADRTGDEDLRRFCTTCIQAEKRGTPFGEILSIQSRELRIRRRQDAEERAQKVPVKILFPMMVFVLPVLMLVVMGPGIAQIMENMGGK